MLSKYEVNHKWTEILETLKLSLSQRQFTHFLNSTATMENDGSLTIELAKSANVEMVEHQLNDVVKRTTYKVFGDIPISYQLPFYDLPEPAPPIMRDYDSEFSELMHSATENEARVTYKLNFVAITGDILAAIILSDLEFWHSPNQKGRSKLRVQHDNEYWIARTNKDWQKITGMTARQVQLAIDRLVKSNLVIKQNYRFNGLKMQHLRINRKVFVELVKQNRTV